MNFKIQYTLIIFFLCLLTDAIAGKSCSQNAICIYTREFNETVEFYAENFKAHKITATLHIVTTNLNASKKVPYTFTVKGKSGKVKILELKVMDLDKDWKYKYHFDWTVGSIHAAHDDEYLYRLPYKEGTSHKIVQGYDGSFSHKGGLKYSLDFEMDEGTPIYSAREGKVVAVYYKSNIGGPDREFIDLENYIFIEHSDGTIAKYLHLKKSGVVVKEGESVERGQFIGYSGNTGFSTTPHLHFGVYTSIDGLRTSSIPIKFISKRGVVEKPVVNEHYVAH